MYSNVVYASLWKAMNGFSESTVEDVPISLPWLLPGKRVAGHLVAPHK
jgi:hypothetical protein